MASTTVSIKKAHLETLLRRAELHDSSKTTTSSRNPLTLTVLRSEYEDLLRDRQEYTALKQSLFGGGITQETLNVLIGNGSVEQGTEADEASRMVKAAKALNLDMRGATQEPRDWAFSDETEKLEQRPMIQPRQSYGNEETYFSSGNDHDDTPAETPSGEGPVYAFSPAAAEQPPYARHEDRTVRLRNISDRAGLKDVLAWIRGGQVLDITMRPMDKACHVSFVEGSAAEAFFTYYRRKDLYIAGKRVDISWSDRQFILPNHVAGKVKGGATRNLVIRNAYQSFYTEQRIREDLDHIHQLVVVEVNHDHGDVYISLNSVHNALYARTCMMSRMMYKGKKIEFYPDNCEQPLPELTFTKSRRESKVPQKLNPLANRFEMLNMEGTEDGSDTASETDGGVPAGTISSGTLSPRDY